MQRCAKISFILIFVKRFDYTFKSVRPFYIHCKRHRARTPMKKSEFFIRTQMARAKLIIAAMQSRAAELSSLYSFFNEIQIDLASVIFSR